MDQRELADLYEYNYWANRRLVQAAHQVSEAQFVAPADFPFGGLRGTLVHIFDAEYSWRRLLQEGVLTEEIVETRFPSLEALVKNWVDEEAAMRAYLASLAEADLGGVVRYTASNGVKRERITWHCLFHVVNHGTQHRSEAAAILTRLGQSPGDMDFTVFLNDRKPNTAQAV